MYQNMDKISHKNQPPNDGHNWDAVAIFERDAVNGGQESHPLLLVRCLECSDERILLGKYFIKG